VSKSKIVVVGAGSSEFGLDSLAGVLRTPELHGLELALVDIDADKLRVVKALADRMNREWDAGMEITAATQAAEALGDARFVLLSVAADREETWKRDHEICWKHGVTSYAENGGPGAFAHACRNLGLILPILRDMERLCPDAYLLNFTNPLTRLCAAICELTSIRCVGICHGIGIGYFILATALHEELGITLHEDPGFKWRDDVIEFFEAYQEIAKAKYEIRAAGINHFTWMLDVYDRQTNLSVYPLVKERMAQLPPIFEPLTQSMFRLFGLVPVQSDTHISEYVPYTADLHEGTWQRYDIQLYDFEWSNERRRKNLKYMLEAAEGRESIEPLKHTASERHEFIMAAMLHNTHAYEEAVNIPNRGYISNLPEGAIVEVPGVVGAEGVTGLHVGPLPEPIAELCRRQLVIDDLLVEAFVTGNRQLVYQLFAIDPMLQDLDEAVSLADELIDAYRDHLPMFA
jgi:alpha-galactosidase